VRSIHGNDISSETLFALLMKLCRPIHFSLQSKKIKLFGKRPVKVVCWMSLIVRLEHVFNVTILWSKVASAMILTESSDLIWANPGTRAYLSTWESGAHWSSALGNLMWIDGLSDKIIKVLNSLLWLSIYIKRTPIDKYNYQVNKWILQIFF